MNYKHILSHLGGLLLTFLRLKRRATPVEQIRLTQRRVLKSLNDSYKLNDATNSEVTTVKPTTQHLPNWMFGGKINLVRAVYDESVELNKQLIKRRDELKNELEKIEIDIKAHDELYSVASKYISITKIPTT